MPEPSIVTIRRRDYVDAKCLRCSTGTYQQASDDQIRCSGCQHTVPRWQTKAEFFMHAAIAALHENEDSSELI